MIRSSHPTQEGLLTYRQASARLGIAEQTLRNMVAQGRIACIRLSTRATRFDPAELDRYIAEKHVEAVNR